MGFVLDIATNLLATIIGVGIGWFGREYALPLIRGRLRDVPNLNRSTWHRRVSDEDPVMTILEIRQSGTSIRASVTRSENGLTRRFVYKGYISGQQLVLNWADSAAKEQVIGAMVLHLSHDLRTLSGSSVYFRHSIGKVVAVERVYDRAFGGAA